MDLRRIDRGVGGSAIAASALLAVLAAAASGAPPAQPGGVNLPFADQAVPATTSPDTTVEIPRDWGNNVKDAAQKLAVRYNAIEKNLTRKGEVFDETITVRIDRDLEYRMLYLAVSTGVERGFLKFNVACHPSGESREVRCLRIEPPAEFKPGRNVLLWRILREGERTRYLFGVSKIREVATLADAAALLKNTTWDADKILVLWPALDLSVQSVVEALNVAAYARVPRVALSLSRVE